MQDELAGHTQQEQQQMSQLREVFRQSEHQEMAKARQIASLEHQADASAQQTRKLKSEITDIQTTHNDNLRVNCQAMDQHYKTHRQN